MGPVLQCVEDGGGVRACMRACVKPRPVVLVNDTQEGNPPCVVEVKGWSLFACSLEQSDMLLLTHHLLIGEPDGHLFNQQTGWPPSYSLLDRLTATTIIPSGWPATCNVSFSDRRNRRALGRPTDHFLIL